MRQIKLQITFEREGKQKVKMKLIMDIRHLEINFTTLLVQKQRVPAYVAGICENPAFPEMPGVSTTA